MKNNKINNTTVADEDRVIKSIMKFYGRHIKNLKLIREGNEKWLIKGDSPFGDSSIIIDQERNWHCEATNQGGDEVDLLRKLNPLLTEKGANLASIQEIVNTPDFDGSIILDEVNFKESLNTFREEVKTWKFIGDAEKSVIVNHNFWTNENLEFKYMELSRTNKPLCRYHWFINSSGGVDFMLTCGVPRIKEHTNADRIYFVESPLQLIFLKETVSDPIYVKPDAEMYSYNNYLKMVEGKDIVYCRSDKPFSAAIKKWDFQLIKRGRTAVVKSFFEG